MVRIIFLDYEREERTVLHARHLSKSLIRQAVAILAEHDDYERFGIETYVVHHFKLGPSNVCYSDRVRECGYAIKVNWLGNGEIHLHLRGPGNREHYAYDYNIVNAEPQIIR